jgi:hypothetical protein
VFFAKGPQGLNENGCRIASLCARFTQLTVCNHLKHPQRAISNQTPSADLKTNNLLILRMKKAPFGAFLQFTVIFGSIGLSA